MVVTARRGPEFRGLRRAAEFLGCSENTINRMRRAGLLHGTQWTEDELMAAKRERAKAPPKTRGRSTPKPRPAEAAENGQEAPPSAENGEEAPEPAPSAPAEKPPEAPPSAPKRQEAPPSSSSSTTDVKPDTCKGKDDPLHLRLPPAPKAGTPPLEKGEEKPAPKKRGGWDGW